MNFIKLNDEAELPSIYNEYSNFLNRDGNSVYLFLHNNISKEYELILDK